MKPKLERYFEQLMKLPVNMMKFPVNAMISSMESIAETLHEIKNKAEPPDEAEADESEDRQRPAFGDAARFMVVPIFEAFKLPRNAFVAGLNSISQTMHQIQEQADSSHGQKSGGAAPNHSRNGIPLSEHEAKLEARARLTPKTAELPRTTLWQIGRAGRRDFEGRWSAVFDYHVGSDLEEIDNPKLPHLLTVQEGPKTKGGTAKLNIHFELDCEYPSDELVFIYDRWGAEKDEVFVDGHLLAPISGAGPNRFKHVALPLKDLSAGKHVITMTTFGETEAGGHRIDFWELAAITDNRDKGVHD